MPKAKLTTGSKKRAVALLKKRGNERTQGKPVLSPDNRDPFLQGIGKAVVDRRAHLRMTQMQLATAAEIGLSSVSHIESASSNTTLLTLLKVARALDIELRDLIPLHLALTPVVKGIIKRA